MSGLSLLLRLASCVALSVGLGPGFGWAPAQAQEPPRDNLVQIMEGALAAAGWEAQALAQPAADHPKAPRLFRQFVTDPQQAWASVDSLRQALPAHRDYPSELYTRLTAQGSTVASAATAASAAATHMPVAVHVDIPEPLAGELRHVLQALALAESMRQLAFATLPPQVSPSALVGSVIPTLSAHPEAAAASWSTLLPLVNAQALHSGMRIALTAAERLRDFVQHHRLPPLVWRTETPWGTVLIDTMGSNNHHVIDHPYLVLDVGGNDHYELGAGAGTLRAGIKLLLDHGGNDNYRSTRPGSDPSGAVLGYAVLWDTQGDDTYLAGWLAQGAALLGAAAHIDDSGHNRYRATGLAQGFALGGQAMLLGSPGHDSYHAQTLAQASAGPGGVALLLEPEGNDHYRLGNEVLVWPSAQLPERNTSMGQGAGFGSRAPEGHVAHMGGLALLLDAAGNDRYAAHVFAQGAGYLGTGLLLDLAGNNFHKAAWYAMGAAAHQGVGVLWAAGAGDESYEASHVTAMGAGHDGAVGMLVDGGGRDRFVLGDLGLGAAHDGGHGVLVRTSGSASYRFTGAACRGWGKPYASADAQTARGVGVFVDATAAHPCPPPATEKKQP